MWRRRYKRIFKSALVYLEKLKTYIAEASFYHLSFGRSSRPEVFYRKGVLRNFAKFTEKHLCHSFRSATILKRRLWYRCFLVNLAKFLRTPFLTEHVWWLLLYLIYFLGDKKPSKELIFSRDMWKETFDIKFWKCTEL